MIRYGDGINPWADLITMAKAWCITKENGRALIGVPSIFSQEREAGFIGFNIGRVYGLLQLSHLFANWKQGKTYYVSKFLRL